MELIEKLEEGDITRLDARDIKLCVQARRTIETLTAKITEPFKTFALERRLRKVYKDDAVTISAAYRTKDQHLSNKALVDMLQTHLEMSGRDNANDKRKDGVRRFDEVLAADATYLCDMFGAWQQVVVGKSAHARLYTRGDVQAILEENRHRLEEEDLYGMNGITTRDAHLYIAADAQSSVISNRIAKPFVKAFKAASKKDESRTVFDKKAFEDVAVQIKTIPQSQANYSQMKEHIEALLEGYSGLGRDDVDGEVTFFNDDVQEPRAYVSITHLLLEIAKDKAATELSYRKEGPQVLYQPPREMILLT